MDHLENQPAETNGGSQLPSLQIEQLASQLEYLRSEEPASCQFLDGSLYVEWGT